MQKVLVGLSGGIDSAVSTYLLLKMGYHVECAFMHNWNDTQDSNCSSSADYLDACKVAEHLNVNLHFVDLSQEYKNDVFMPFLDSLNNNLTPNPDIWCNKHIKFKHFLFYAQKKGFDFIATGHYAKISKIENEFYLCKAQDENKDQTYFLYTLSQQQIQKTIFPLHNLTKTSVKKIAKEIKLPNLNKKESMGICFISQAKFADFISPYLLDKPGPILTTDNQKIGNHKGLFYHTIGQRKGLAIGGLANFNESCWYVVKKDAKNNALYVSQDPNDPALYNTKLEASSLHWINSAPNVNTPLLARIRHRQALQECKITEISQNKISVEFNSPQRAISSGQSVVFFQNNYCLGGAIIL